jgi:hypothetical protein
VLEEGADPRLAPRHGQGRADDGVDELGARSGQHLELEGLLRPEVREQAALRHSGAGCERADRQAAETDPVGDLDTVVQDRLSGQRTLAHGK